MIKRRIDKLIRRSEFRFGGIHNYARRVAGLVLSSAWLLRSAIMRNVVWQFASCGMRRRAKYPAHIGRRCSKPYTS